MDKAPLLSIILSQLALIPFVANAEPAKLPNQYRCSAAGPKGEKSAGITISNDNELLQVLAKQNKGQVYEIGGIVTTPAEAGKVANKGSEVLESWAGYWKLQEFVAEVKEMYDQAAEAVRNRKGNGMMGAMGAGAGAVGGFGGTASDRGLHLSYYVSQQDGMHYTILTSEQVAAFQKEYDLFKQERDAERARQRELRQASKGSRWDPKAARPAPERLSDSISKEQRPGDIAAKQERPGDVASKTWRPGDAAAWSSRPGDIAATEKRPGDHAAKEARPGDKAAQELTPGQIAGRTLREGDKVPLRPGDLVGQDGVTVFTAQLNPAGNVAVIQYRVGNHPLRQVVVDPKNPSTSSDPILEKLKPHLDTLKTYAACCSNDSPTKCVTRYHAEAEALLPPLNEQELTEKQDRALAGNQDQDADRSQERGAPIYNPFDIKQDKAGTYGKAAK